MYNKIRRLQTTNYGAGANPTGSPVGGGVGYKKIITPSQATYIVSTLTDLKNRLASATAGQIVYVSDTASINMTGQSNIVIPPGVTLASGRGSGSGALLYTTSYPYPLFSPGGAGVRITGLRIQGAYPDIGTPTDGIPNSSGIAATYSSLEVDNVEMWAWTYGAVHVRDGATNVYIHHSNIHHNRHTGYGYGVVVGIGSAIIEANLFNYNKHSIAAGYLNPSSYEARYNIVGDNDTSWNFDRHSLLAPGGYAGNSTLLHHNTFTRLSSSQYSIRISGIPQEEARINNNWFYRNPTISSPVMALYDINGNPLWQSSRCLTYPEGCVSNIYVYDNWYGTAPPPTTGCVALASCTAVCPTSSILQGNPISLPVSWSGGQSPFILRVYKDNVLHGNPINITSNSTTLTIPTDTSWTAGSHNIYVQITDSCSTLQTCNTNICTLNITTVTPPPPPPPPPPTPELVGYWKFDERAGTSSSDSSGKGNTANLINTTWVNGITGGALQFNGTSSYAEILKSATLDSITSNITIIAWIKAALMLRGAIVERWLQTPTADRAYVLTIEPTGSIEFILSSNGSPPATGTGDLISSGIISANTWTHIAAVSDGTTMKIYINGQQDINTTSAPAGGIYKSAANVHIGAWQYSPTALTAYFNGIIDELKIFNYALSSTEILNDYNRVIACPNVNLTFRIN